MGRRGLDEGTVARAVRERDQVIRAGGGREIRQALVSLGDALAPHLVRVVVEPIAGGWAVVTAYRTSKVEKYWRPQ